MDLDDFLFVFGCAVAGFLTSLLVVALWFWDNDAAGATIAFAGVVGGFLAGLLISRACR